jgi:hypothetical protein
LRTPQGEQLGLSANNSRHLGGKMSHIGLLASVGFMLLLTSGCTTYYAPRYSVSMENMASLKNTKEGNKIHLGTFSSYKPGLQTFGCRGAGPVGAPQPFEQYIRRAMETELQIADIFDPNGPLEVSAHLNRIAMSSNIGIARWEISMTFSAPGKESFVVDVVHKTDSAWNGQQACFLVAQGFPGAVQELLFQTFNHPVFRSWTVKQTKAQAHQ